MVETGRLSTASVTPGESDGDAADEAGETGSSRPGVDVLGIALAILLAAVGLVGALVAWRIVDEGNVAADASRSALTAAREQSGATLQGEGTTAQAFAAWIDYELSHRRADALRDAGYTDQALEADKEASAHWPSVYPEYASGDGSYDADGQIAGVLASKADSVETNPAPYLAAARAAEDHQRELSLVAVLVAMALPLLTGAELAKGWLRALATIAGTGIFAAGVATLVMVW